MSEERIRAMTRQDVSRVYEIELACFRSPWSKQALLGELKNDVARYLVCEADGAVCGYAGMWVLFEEAHMTNIAIVEEYRRQGRARRLMLEMMRLAARLGAQKMTLEVREGNLAAQRLYRTLDFAQNGRRPRYYPDTGEDALLLWNLNIQHTIDRERQSHETI